MINTFTSISHNNVVFFYFYCYFFSEYDIRIGFEIFEVFNTKSPIQLFSLPEQTEGESRSIIEEISFTSGKGQKSIFWALIS